MTETLIVDTSALIALIYEKDARHNWAKSRLANLRLPYLTCEAVITEACFLLKGVHDGQQTVLSYLSNGILEIDFDLSTEVERIAYLMKRYENVPMSFADACLVRMSEQRANAVVFTLDGDFRIYRRNEKEIIEVVIPD